MAGEQALLTIENLAVSFIHGSMEARALRGIDLNLRKGEIHGLVGESGSGKTVTSTCVMGLLQWPGKIVSGRIAFDGKDLATLSEGEFRAIRGRKIAMVFQEPAKYLNPAYKVGEQITEMLRLHLGMDKAASRARAAELLELVGLGKDGRVLDAYPHELSGGMKQRAMIAMAISCGPEFLIADEPTTALDVTLQLQILKLIGRLRDSFGMGVLFISHDLGVVDEIADWVSVIYAGRIVESAPRAALFGEPAHPYTRLLLQSIPDARKRGTRLASIPGRVPDADNVPEGCAFHTRCPIAEDVCRAKNPVLAPRRDAAAHLVACHLTEKPWNI